MKHNQTGVVLLFKIVVATKQISCFKVDNYFIDKNSIHY